jgi:hypothetical protein
VRRFVKRQRRNQDGECDENLDEIDAGQTLERSMCALHAGARSDKTVVCLTNSKWGAPNERPFAVA